ncbi:hypothetical protein FOMPIDRAFT_1056276 [Fomitopsis schrenkii]|uniref:Uncharacterized protein n=1 Tax=Fomitopsis schrenkii TaxID=2126942 RepID=S8DHR0_FOMSC|nr:hypothetical protein FOMPIDRAFT_1056276 [Fomitopsis schrenkii]
MVQHLVLVCLIDSARRKPRYSSLLSESRGHLRSVLTNGLREATGVPEARMRYNEHDLWKHVVCRYGYKLVGWPAHIPFANLSAVKGGRRPLEELLQLWNTGRLTFVRVASRSEIDALKPRTTRKRASRRDLGTHRKPRCCGHRGAITPLAILPEVDMRVDAEMKAFEREHGRRLAEGELADGPIELFEDELS